MPMSETVDNPKFQTLSLPKIPILPRELQTKICDLFAEYGIPEGFISAFITWEGITFAWPLKDANGKYLVVDTHSSGLQAATHEALVPYAPALRPCFGCGSSVHWDDIDSDSGKCRFCLL